MVSVHSLAPSIPSLAPPLNETRLPYRVVHSKSKSSCLGIRVLQQRRARSKYRPAGFGRDLCSLHVLKDLRLVLPGASARGLPQEQLGLAPRSLLDAA